MRLAIVLICVTGLTNLKLSDSKPDDNQDNFEWFEQRFKKKGSNKKRQSDCPACQCGIANTERIIGGQETSEQKYPWMTYVISYLENNTGTYNCGGTLINNKYVLTAAHCIKTFGENMTLTFLEHNTVLWNDILIARRVEEIIIHEDYNSTTLDSDIALLKLDEEIDLSDSQNSSVLVRPVCLPPQGQSYGEETGIATGWGFISANGPTSDTLKEVELTIIPDDECYDVYNFTTPNMLCAGSRNGTQGICSGDSGGPLLFYNETVSVYQQVGVTSWAVECGAEEEYDGFTKLSNFVDWIHENTDDACYCSEFGNDY